MMHDSDLALALWELEKIPLWTFKNDWGKGAPMPVISEQDLWLLSSLDDGDVLECLAMLPYLPSELLEELYQMWIDRREYFNTSSIGFAIERGLACNPNLPFSWFFEFELDDTLVERNLFENKSTPPEIFFLLNELHARSEDEHDSIAHNHLRGSAGAQRTSLDSQIRRDKRFQNRINEAIKTREDADRFSNFELEYFNR